MTLTTTAPQRGPWLLAPLGVANILGQAIQNISIEADVAAEQARLRSLARLIAELEGPSPIQFADIPLRKGLSLSVGEDCGGLLSVCQALEEDGYAHYLRFFSEVDPRLRKRAASLHPGAVCYEDRARHYLKFSAQ